MKKKPSLLLRVTVFVLSISIRCHIFLVSKQAHSFFHIFLPTSCRSRAMSLLKFERVMPKLPIQSIVSRVLSMSLYVGTHMRVTVGCPTMCSRDIRCSLTFFKMVYTFSRELMAALLSVNMWISCCNIYGHDFDLNHTGIFW